MKISLNLLPPLQKKILHTKHVFRTILDQQVFGFFLLLLIVLCLVGVNTVLSTEVSSLEKSNEDLVARSDYAEILELHKLFTTTNRKVGMISAIQSEHIVWENVLRLLSDNIPRDITMRSLRTEDSKLALAGVAQTIDALVSFQTSVSGLMIDDEKCFLDVDVPDQFLVNSVDVKFEMSFLINTEACMKEVL